MLDRDGLERLRSWIAARTGRPDLVVEEVAPLQGGSIQENWRIRCRWGEGGRTFVLRRDAPATISSSRSRAEEFALIAAAHRAGVRVPEPVGFCDDEQVIGAPFALMGHVDGVALGARVVKEAALGGDRAGLAEALGAELARIHAVRPPRREELAFLGEPDPDPARAMVAALRATLDRLGRRRPSLEWGLRWAELHAPRCARAVLVHGDFRTGNYMVDGAGLVAILDWEFAGWGDPHADLGWFCARCWRFARPDLEAGGIADRASLYRGYEAADGGPISDEAVRFWEVMAHLRWAVIALEQGQRHLSGAETSLELALTGRLVPDLERAVLGATAPTAWRAHAG